MNKKGQLWTILIVIGSIIALLFIMFAGLLGWAAVKSATDVLIPELNTIGDIGDGNNISEYTVMVLTPVDSVISGFGLFMGLIYIIGTVGILAMAFMFRNNHSTWGAMLFVICVLLVIVTAIFVSNAYEDVYLSQDEIGEELRSATLASYLIINSPVILTIIAFIAGIILFTGKEESGLNV